MTGGAAIEREHEFVRNVRRQDVAALVVEHYEMLVRLARLMVADEHDALDAVRGAAERSYDGDLQRALDDAVPELQLALFTETRRWNARHRVKVPPMSTLDAASRVMNALQQLSARQRECVVLRHYLGYTEKQIARVVGLSLGSVRTHQRRGMAFLVGMLSPDDAAGPTLERLLRDAMHTYADHDVEPLSTRDIVVALEQHDRNKLVHRIVVAGVALVIAVVVGWGLVPGSRHGHRPVRVENPSTSVPSSGDRRGAGRVGNDEHQANFVAMRATNVTPLSSPSNPDVPGVPSVTPGSSSVSSPGDSGSRLGPGQDGSRTGASTPATTPDSTPATTPVSAPVSTPISTPDTVPVTDPTTPATTPAAHGAIIDTASFWAIGVQVQGGTNNELLVHMPPGQHTVSYAELAFRVITTKTINDSEGGTFALLSPSAWASANPSWAVQCISCPDAFWGGTFADQVSSMPNYLASFSAFAVNRESDTGGFVIGGASSAADGTRIDMSSPYGGGSFTLHGGVWGGIVKFPDAPLNAPFPVTLSSTAGDAFVSVTRTR